MTSEFDLIGRYFTRSAGDAVLGVGDDCALVDGKPGMQLALSTDMLLEGTHFVAGTDPERLGRKSLSVNLSDLAACGAEPAYALLALALPAADESWVEAFARGFFAVAERYGVALIGGDTTRGPLAICVTILGKVPAGLALQRSGARAGDDVWVSGATGEAGLALAQLKGATQLPHDAFAECLRRLEDPVPRVELGIRLRGLASSAIDVSDGLIADLGHIAERSHVALDIALERLPITDALQACPNRALAFDCMAGGGDDYELAFTAPISRRDEIERIAGGLMSPVTRIGSVRHGNGATLLDASGKPVPLGRSGFDHFAK